MRTDPRSPVNGESPLQFGSHSFEEKIYSFRRLLRKNRFGSTPLEALHRHSVLGVLFLAFFLLFFVLLGFLALRLFGESLSL
jgi:hypothetical protein